MKSLTTQLALSLTLILGSLSNAFAADINYPQTGPIFAEDAYLVGGIGEIDTFYFTNTTAGTYNFYSVGSVDLTGQLWSDTYGYQLDYNDDGVASFGGFCVEYYLFAPEAVTLIVQGWSSGDEGDYTIVGSAGTCADSAAAGWPNPNASSSSDSGSFSLPAILFTILGLGAVRLRRIFA